MSLAAVLIVKNEEKNIEDCLRALSFCDEIIVVDSGSSDHTVLIASKYAKVLQRDFDNFSTQKNYAISQASSEWILSVDADERVVPALAEEIRKCLKAPTKEGYFLMRQNRIFFRWMRHGANARDYQLRLVKKEKAQFQGLVHERIEPPIKAGYLQNELLHYSTNTMGGYMIKLNAYSSLEARRLKESERPCSLRQMRWRPLFLLFYLSVWKRGILDGIEGLFFSVLSAYNEFVRYAKQWELEKKEGMR